MYELPEPPKGYFWVADYESHVHMSLRLCHKVWIFTVTDLRKPIQFPQTDNRSIISRHVWRVASDMLQQHFDFYPIHDEVVEQYAERYHP